MCFTLSEFVPRVEGVGKKEVARARNDGIDIRHLAGLHVVTEPTTYGWCVTTVYRNASLAHLRKPARQGRLHSSPPIPSRQ